MPSFAHKKLVERIAHLGEPPTEIAAYAEWIKAGEHLSLLRENANEGEIIIYASGRYAFIHSALVSNDRLSPVDKRDLLGWNCYPHASAASYAWGGGHEGIWIERGMHNSGAKTLEGAQQLAFERFFEGWTGDGRTYCEILQEYAHLTDIHWRPEQHAYCRFDERGDIDHVVSITKRDDKQSVTLVSFERESLECYLEASNSTLIRIFDFTLFRPENFSRWPDGNCILDCTRLGRA